MRQIRQLWSSAVVRRLFSTVITFATVGLAAGGGGGGASAATPAAATAAAAAAAAEKKKEKKKKKKKKIFSFRLFSRQDATVVTDSVTSIRIHSVCQLFALLIDVCSLYSSEILSGLVGETAHRSIYPNVLEVADGRFACCHKAVQIKTPALSCEMGA